MIDDGIRRHAHYDPGARTFTFEVVQDVEPILENNAVLRGERQTAEAWRHVADIPNVIYQQWFNEYNAGRAKPDLRIFGNPEFDRFVQRKLRDPNWKKLRTYDPATNFTRGWG